MNLQDVVLPGESHPAIIDYRTVLQSIPRSRHIVEIPIKQRAKAREVDDGTIEKLLCLTFRRSQAYQSFEIQYGAYVWDIWTDQYGRSLTVEDYAVWEANQNAFIYGEYNPTFKEE